MEIIAALIFIIPTILITYVNLKEQENIRKENNGEKGESNSL